MPFGLGLLELILVLVPFLVVGGAAGLAFLALRRFVGARRPDSQLLEEHNRQLSSELRETRERVESLEAQVAQMQEGLTFTQSLLETRGGPAQVRPPER